MEFSWCRVPMYLKCCVPKHVQNIPSTFLYFIIKRNVNYKAMTTTPKYYLKTEFHCI